MDMQHLKLVEGYSYELIIQRLKRLRLEFIVETEPFVNGGVHGGYFRDSLIRIKNIDGMIKVEKRLKGYYCNSPICLNYYGRYDIQPDFDWSQINGKIRFDNGRLVERIKLELDKEEH